MNTEQAAPVKSRERIDPRVTRMRSLNERINKLIKLGLKLTQIAEILGSSYSGLHRARNNDLDFSKGTLAKYHENLDKWAKKVGAI
jgi:hypothetical protein